MHMISSPQRYRLCERQLSLPIDSKPCTCRGYINSLLDEYEYSPVISSHTVNKARLRDPLNKENQSVSSTPSTPKKTVKFADTCGKKLETIHKVMMIEEKSVQNFLK